MNVSYNKEKIAYNFQLGYNNGISTYRYNASQCLANTNVMRTSTYQKDDSDFYNFQAGMDYKLNNKNKFGLNVRGSVRKSDRVRLGSLYTTNREETQLIFNTESENPIIYSQHNVGLTADYTFQHKILKSIF